MKPEEYSFSRYLSAKKSVDDRSLNREVWERLTASLPPTSSKSPLRILEVGAGIGTMAARLLERGLARHVRYTGVDNQAENTRTAPRDLEAWAQERGMPVRRSAGLLSLGAEPQAFQATFVLEDLSAFIARERGSHRWDLVLAHAFLDLVDVPAVLPGLFSLLSPGGLFLFSVNFDGLTILEPTLDPLLDEQVMALYHRTMDERMQGDVRSGDSRTGRHMFHHLANAGAEIMAAGASDWVVYPGPQGYPDDEAYFLHFIIHTIHLALAGHAELDAARFAAWIEDRHSQIERRELVYIAHQLDFLGRLSA